MDVFDRLASLTQTQMTEFNMDDVAVAQGGAGYGRHGGFGPAIGIALAGGASLVLWLALAQAVRWAAALL